ncbi:DUF4225 domain-containing protein [Pseudomonas sp. TMW22091]|uniref:DUF4225 domain-containing protein n=1 Tax=Pseudomonas sp. TMW22091 TaxID=2506435 RepID=UPI001F0DC0A2|nr:DUF4225 domain-containing protein [Pseudomonas sp. TMW22091]MCH4873423.1 DUF4225 domain-containing protein [Pseudomonas sp. TMW22091]
MRPDKSQHSLADDEVRALDQAVNLLTNQACTVGIQRLKNLSVRLQFNRDITEYTRGIVQDVYSGKKSTAQGLEAINKQRSALIKHTLLDQTLLGVGIAAGGMQIAMGGGICYFSAGTLCLGIGAPLMLQGGNNIYENGRNLLSGRSDTQGPIRKVYHSVAKAVGGTEREGNIAYGVVDLAGSAYGAGRLVLKPESWRLFRHIRSDYLYGYQRNTVGGAAIGKVSDVNTLQTLFEYWGADE